MHSKSLHCTRLLNDILHSIQAPHNHISRPPTIIMEVTIEPPPTLLISRILQMLFQRVLQLLKEHQVLRPLSAVLTFELGVLAHPMHTGARSHFLDSLCIFHISLQPRRRARGDIKLVGLVQVRGALGQRDMERGFAGKGPGGNFRVDQVRAPRGGVAGHEEAGGGVGYVVFVLEIAGGTR